MELQDQCELLFAPGQYLSLASSVLPSNGLYSPKIRHNNLYSEERGPGSLVATDALC